MKIDAQGSILIGGKSRRFGSDKVYLQLENEFVSERIYQLLSSIFTETCLIASISKKKPVAGALIYYDKIPGQGPLRGLLTALSHTRHPYSFVLACDMPFVNVQLIRNLWRIRDSAEAIIPFYKDKAEPLFAFYHQNCIPEIESALEKGKRKMDSFWSNLSIKKIDVSKYLSDTEIERTFFNINSKSDYNRVIKEL